MAGQYRFKDINGNIVAQISASAAGAIAMYHWALQHLPRQV